MTDITNEMLLAKIGKIGASIKRMAAMLDDCRLNLREILEAHATRREAFD